MTEESAPGQKISREDIESVSEKLAKLATDLPEAERAVLGLVLARAQAAPEDVGPAAVTRERHPDAAAEEQAAMRTPGPEVSVEAPFAGQLARAAGLFAKPEVTVVVGWQFRFGMADGPDGLVLPADQIGEGPA